jgi:dynein heavy chain
MVEIAAGAFEKDPQQVEDVFREHANLKRLNDFLEGKSKHHHIFIFDQRADVMNDMGEPIDGPGDTKIIITTGESERLKGRAVYFFRTLPAEKAVKLDVGSDGDLLFGEIAANPLESLDASLGNLYLPFLRRQGNDWGVCDNEQKKEFLDGFDKFSGELSEAVSSLSGGITLKSMDPQYEASIDQRSLASTDAVRDNPEIVQHFESLLDQWCRQIEAYLEESLDQQMRGREGSDPGPRTELEYWRARMQRITSITEQLKSKDAKLVFGVLHAVTRVNQDVAPKSRQVVFNTLRRWKQIEISITEAFNEARDNVKYLATLEKFLEPLYSGTPTYVAATLPALMNSVKMIHTIARYYNTTERMTNLFTKITNQMISNCKDSILDGDEKDEIWDKDPLHLIKNLEACLRLNEAYQEQYRVTKDKLLTLPKGKQFDFSETQIFGRFDLFCRRIVKLIDMFSTIHQFRSLSEHRFDGMERLIHSFNSILEEFRNKRHDLLDFHQNRFDRDYVEFNVRISELESALQQFINQSFEQISSIETSLKLLKKFKSILQRDSLRADLESKYVVIFHNYGLELTQVQDQYEKHKSSPPLVRNLPPVAGNITWSRHLLRRIEEPMKKFQSNPTVLGGKDAKKIIRMYNKMAKTLVEFETLWYQAWVASIDSAKNGLSATLIVRHPEDGKLHVNFDWDILQLVREAKCLSRMASRSRRRHALCCSRNRSSSSTTTRCFTFSRNTAAACSRCGRSPPTF